MKSRTQARQVALQYLYMADAVGHGNAESIPGFLHENLQDDGVTDFCTEIIRKTLSNCKAIDAEIEKAADNWDIARIAPVELNAIRIGTCELMFMDTPPSVALDEAIELGKIFGSKDSGKFVNGVLDCIRKNTEG